MSQDQSQVRGEIQSQDPSQSQSQVPPAPSQGKSNTTYNQMVLFVFNEDEEEPFFISRFALLKGSNFPWNVIEGGMTNEMRLTQYHISALDLSEDGPYGLFAKIEEGMHFLYNSTSLDVC